MPSVDQDLTVVALKEIRTQSRNGYQKTGFFGHSQMVRAPGIKLHLSHLNPREQREVMSKTCMSGPRKFLLPKQNLSARRASLENPQLRGSQQDKFS